MRRRQWCDRLDELPKAELHLHLEGAVPGECMAGLARKYGAAWPNPAPASPPSFDAFLEAMRYRFGLLREYDDFTEAAASVAGRLVEGGVIYAELHFSPESFRRRYGLDPSRLAEAIHAGLHAGAAGRLETGLIVDVVRDNGPRIAERIVRDIADIAPAVNILAVGLGGTEHAYPASVFRAAFDLARSAGLRCVAHAGETLGPESVRDVIRSLNVDRIGHGISAYRDPRLVAYLREAGTPIEVCISSNLRTGAVSALESHPLRSLADAEVCIVLGSDDPAMFDTDIAAEYRLAYRRLGLSGMRIRNIARAGFERSFAAPDVRRSLLDLFDHHWPVDAGDRSGSATSGRYADGTDHARGVIDAVP